jgi:hypothetical protein
MNFAETSWLAQWHVLLVALLIAWVAVSFVLRFALPAWRLRQTLDDALDALTSMRAQAGSGSVDPSRIAQEVMRDARLAHLWSQYADTLHAQWGHPDSGPMGTRDERVTELSNAFFAQVKARTGGAVVDLAEIEQHVSTDPQLAELWQEYSRALEALHRQDKAGSAVRVQRWRATAVAETFFSDHALVDSPLRTDFYKHVPGILTGLGIIGTFSGLIMGLVHFDVSSPERVQAELSRLVQTVGHAFFVSAAAIALAMLFTWIEKSLLSARYRQAEELRHLIDSLFDAGAGEEYLERLVAAAESQATAMMEMLGQARERDQDLAQALNTLTLAVRELRQSLQAPR